VNFNYLTLESCANLRHLALRLSTLSYYDGSDYLHSAQDGKRHPGIGREMNDQVIPLSFAALVFFGATALVILLYRLDIKDSAAIVAIIIAPLLVHGIASGKILELTGPGGWGAKFQAAAEQKVIDTATRIAFDMEELQKVQKEGLAKLDEIVRKLQKGKPVALILDFGRQGYYVADVVREYADKLSKFDPETSVILVDNVTKRFVATIDVRSFLNVLDTDPSKLISAISTADRAYLVRFPGFIFRGIRDDKTNAQALKEMYILGVRTLVVLNGQDEPVALVRRDQIIDHIVEKLP
jgi:hypothetical protein